MILDAIQVYLIFGEVLQLLLSCRDDYGSGFDKVAPTLPAYLFACALVVIVWPWIVLGAFAGAAQGPAP